MDNPYLEDIPEELASPEKCSESEAKQEIAFVREALNYHDRKYYLENSPEISDHDYDRLFRFLEELEKEFPRLDDPNSPTKRVGAPPIDELETVQHPVPLLSLSSSLEEAEIRDFDRFLADQLGHHDFRYYTDCKFDGLSVALTYENGSFETGATRGDGRRGENVSRNLRTIHRLPLELSDQRTVPERLVVRGEVFMRLEPFQELNERRVAEGKDPFANPRNAAAGTLRQLDPSVPARRPLDLFLFELLDTTGEAPETQVEAMEWLRDWGFPVHEEFLRTGEISEAISFRNRMVEQRDRLPFEIDGTVIKVDEWGLREELGVRQSNPRWAIAYKFPPRDEETVVQKIGVQVGRTGKLTPVAFLKPVDVGGVTISRASLHNYDEVREKDIRKGDRVKVIRAGDVIPYVEKRVDDRPDSERSEPFEMPKECPACGSAVTVEGAYHMCTGGMACPAQRQGMLEHFVSRDAMDIEGLGEKEVRKIRDMGLVSTPADLYSLTEEELLEAGLFKNETYLKLHRGTQNPELAIALYALDTDHIGPSTAIKLAEQFSDVESLLEASEEELLRQFGNDDYEFFREETDAAGLARAIYGVGLEGVGPNTAIDLAECFDGLDEFLEASIEQLEEVPGIGKISAEQIHQQLRDETVRQQLRTFVDQPVELLKKLSPFAYKILEGVRNNRDKLKQYVDQPEKARARVGKSVHNLLSEIEQSKQTSLDRFLYSLGIRHVGRHVSRVLAEEYDTVEEIMEAGIEELQEIEDIGPEVARSIREYFDQSKNRDVIASMLKRGVNPKPLEREAGDRPLDGMTFVITGSLPDMSRQEATEEIESRGGRVTSSVSGNTDYLVVGENPGQAKREDADEHDTPQLSPEEFEELLTS